MAKNLQQPEKLLLSNPSNRNIRYNMDSKSTQEYRAALRTKSTDQWLAAIKTRIDSITMQRWIANAVCYYHPDKPVKGDPIVTFSEGIGSISYKQKELEQAHWKLGLPFFKTASVNSDPSSTRNRPSHNGVTSAQRSRTPGALKFVKFNKKEMEAAG